MAVDYGSPWLQVDYGLDLLDSTGAWVMSLDDDLVAESLSVDMDAERTIGATVSFAVTRELDWGTARVRPNVTVTDATGASESWDLGVFVLDTPERVIAETPPTWQVQGSDLTAVLDTPAGAAMQVTTSDYVLTKVADLIVAQVPGATVNLSPVSVLTACTEWSWPLDESNTVLRIVNDLLAQVGYEPLWCDRDGTFRSDPVPVVATRTPVLTIDADADVPVVGEDRTVVHDMWSSPNQWTFVAEAPAGDAPVEGAGLYVVANAFDGPSSISERGGRVVRKVVRLAVADQTALQALGDAIVAADRAQTMVIRAVASPLPGLWHATPVRYVDAAVPVDATMTVVRWRLGVESHDLELVAGWLPPLPERERPRITWGEVVDATTGTVRPAGDVANLRTNKSTATLANGDIVLLVPRGSGYSAVKVS